MLLPSGGLLTLPSVRRPSRCLLTRTGCGIQVCSPVCLAFCPALHLSCCPGGTFIDQTVENTSQKQRYIVATAAYVPVSEEISHYAWDILTQGMRLPLCPTVPFRRPPQVEDGGRGP